MPNNGPPPKGVRVSRPSPPPPPLRYHPNEPIRRPPISHEENRKWATDFAQRLIDRDPPPDPVGNLVLVLALIAGSAGVTGIILSLFR